MLKEKALEVRDALLESLVSKARDQNNDIISRYEAILSRIAEKPANEADLAALRGFIADSKEKVRRLPVLTSIVHSVALGAFKVHSSATFSSFESSRDISWNRRIVIEYIVLSRRGTAFALVLFSWIITAV